MNLSETQLHFLQWLADNHLFEICIEKGKSFGSTIGLHKFDGNFCKRTIERLKKEKLVSTKTVRHLSLRYEQFSVTEKGCALLALRKLKQMRGL